MASQSIEPRKTSVGRGDPVPLVRISRKATRLGRLMQGVAARVVALDQGVNLRTLNALQAEGRIKLIQVDEREEQFTTVA